MDFVRTIAKKYNKSYRITVFWRTFYCITKAKDAEKILNSSKHLQKGEIYSLLDPFLKTGLLTSAGEKWFKRRRMLTPAFHFSILKEYFNNFNEESDRLVSDLKRTKGQEVNIVQISTQFTLNAVCGKLNFFLRIKI
jgi:cytochrome P450 family 4